MSEHERGVSVDMDAYVHELLTDTREGRCFVCDVVANPSERHIVYEDDFVIAFLPRQLTMKGRLLLAPKEHKTEVVGDFTEESYLDLQRRVFRLGRAVSAAFATERLYVLSLGSKEGVAHVHWHIAALPPGVPLEQQYYALMIENGCLDLTDDDLSEIARQICDFL